ncbi:MAG: hypothetical protein WC012_07855 [Thiohalomonadaceae bacterium]
MVMVFQLLLELTERVTVVDGHAAWAVAANKDPSSASTMPNRDHPAGGRQASAHLRATAPRDPIRADLRCRRRPGVSIQLFI